jgi:hypothetical protein
MRLWPSEADSFTNQNNEVRKYRRLKNIAALLLAAVYFNCVWLAG